MLKRILDSFRKKDKQNSSTDLYSTSNSPSSSSSTYTNHTTTTNNTINNNNNGTTSTQTTTIIIDEYFFHCAGVLGKFSNVKEILDQKENANVKDHMNRNILHHACQWGNLETVKYGISRGIPVNVKDSLGNTPLHYCCGEGYFTIVSQLLQHPKIRIDMKNKEGHTPRRRAYFHGQDDVLILLDKYMGNINLFKERLKNQVLDVESNYTNYKLSDISIRTQQY